jgi:type I restriction enzyme, S subunit
MPEKLPQGWVKTNLGEVCVPVAMIQPEKSPDTEFTYFDIGGIDNERNRIAETKAVTGRNAPSRARQLVREDDILFSTVRTYLRKIARIDRSYTNPVASTGFCVIRAAEGVLSQFLFFQVLSEKFLQPLHLLQTGSSYPAVRARDVFAQSIMLAPAREQERIVAKLDAALSQIAAGEMAARRARVRLQRYRTAVLQAAATGDLTRAWRESQRKKKKPKDGTGESLLQRLITARRVRWEKAELQRLRAVGKVRKDETWKSRYHEPSPPDANDLAELPKRWAWASIDQLSWDSGYGTSVKCTHESKGPAVLRIPNIRNRGLDFSDLKFAANSRVLADNNFVAPGDFLLIRTNGSKDLIGRAAVVRTEPKRRCGFASYLIRFRLVGREKLWSWLAIAWDSPFVRIRIEAKAATTAGQYNVSLSGLSGMAIPLPPIAEQSEILREVELRLAAADRLEAALEQQLVRAHAARQSLLLEAFTGRLVSQDPNDEAASVLLERIRTLRKTESERSKVKPMPKRKSKSKAARRPLLDVLHQHKKPITPEQLFMESGYQREFEDNESRQEIVDNFYEELRQLVGPKGQVLETRPNHSTVLLEAKE